MRGKQSFTLATFEKLLSKHQIRFSDSNGGHNTVNNFNESSESATCRGGHGMY